MRIVMLVLVIASVMFVSAGAEPPGFRDDLLDRLAGAWVMTGMIAGEETTHDVVAEWVLGHYYLRLSDISREKDEQGAPEYEAIVIIGWDEPSNRYACLWLDCTGGGGLGGPIGYGARSDDEIPFVFDDGTGSVIRNTFRYVRDEDAWTWLIDVERESGRTSFARVTLTRP
ncbi:MAG: hypothetical protein ABIK65_09405 [Candidatus Eisenbacteria bacterium]